MKRIASKNSLGKVPPVKTCEARPVNVPKHRSVEKENFGVVLNLDDL